MDHRAARGLTALTAVLGLLAGSLTLAACSGSDSGSVAPPQPSSASPSGAVSSAASASAPAAPASVHRSVGATVVATGSAPYPTPGRVPALRKDQTSVLDALPGSSSPACAPVGTHPDLHSGSVAAGNFVAAHQAYRAQVGKTEQPQIGLYLIPQHAAHLSTATVVVDPEGSGPSRTVVSEAVERADADRYFSVRFFVPKPGTYRLLMRSGRDHGCFIVTF